MLKGIVIWTLSCRNYFDHFFKYRRKEEIQMNLSDLKKRRMGLIFFYF